MTAAADWMLEAPPFARCEGDQALFAAAWDLRDLAAWSDRAPAAVPPLWAFLQWLARQGLLLHGSPLGELDMLRPGRKDYRQPDEFSNTTGVYAASDGLWAMMYALRGPRVASQNDMGLRVREERGWSAMRSFLSLAPRPGDPVRDARELLVPGTVYVLSPDGFAPSPPYDHPGLGHVQEAHWVHPGPVRPLWAIPVSPADFPLPVRLHDAAEVRRRSLADPWGFPWLDPERGAD